MWSWWYISIYKRDSMTIWPLFLRFSWSLTLMPFSWVKLSRWSALFDGHQIMETPRPKDSQQSSMAGYRKSMLPSMQAYSNGKITELNELAEATLIIKRSSMVVIYFPSICLIPSNLPWKPLPFLGIIESYHATFHENIPLLCKGRLETCCTWGHSSGCWPRKKGWNIIWKSSKNWIPTLIPARWSTLWRAKWIVEMFPKPGSHWTVPLMT